MRILFKEGKQTEFLKEAITLSKLDTIKEFTDSISVNYNTFKNWISSKRLLPKDIFDEITHRYPTLKNYQDHISEIKENVWGQKIGGEKAYKIILNKYGIEEIKKRQMNGGKTSKRRKEFSFENFKINFNDILFLEFYGALLGDGWISIFTNKKSKKKTRFIGFSGHIKNDKDYLNRIRWITKKLFNRNGYSREKIKYNAIEFTFGHIGAINILNRELKFPIGLKTNLKIEDRFLDNWDLSKYIIRGLFDTDGCLAFDKDPRYKKPYPIIDITTYSKELKSQLKEILTKNGYSVIVYQKGIRLKGTSQTIKWFKEIKPKNNRHILKYEKFVMNLPE